LFFLFCFQ